MQKWNVFIKPHSHFIESSLSSKWTVFIPSWFHIQLVLRLRMESRKKYISKNSLHLSPFHLDKSLAIRLYLPAHAVTIFISATRPKSNHLGYQNKVESPWYFEIAVCVLVTPTRLAKKHAGSKHWYRRILESLQKLIKWKSKLVFVNFPEKGFLLRMCAVFGFVWNSETCPVWRD